MSDSLTLEGTLTLDSAALDFGGAYLADLIAEAFGVERTEHGAPRGELPVRLTVERLDA